MNIEIFLINFTLLAKGTLFLNIKKKYYVFTDSHSDKFSKYSNVTVVPVENNCWPLNTLLRFSYFSKIVSDLQPNTYTFFF